MKPLLGLTQFLCINNAVNSFIGYSGYDNPLDQNTCTTQVEKEIPLQELAELLGVTPDVNPSEDGSCCSLRPETDSAQQKQRAVCLIQASVSQHLPKPPSDLDQNLHQHLINVQETVPNELLRLSPLLEEMGLTECLINCYHRQTLGHIDELLKNVQSCKKSFVLMNWILHAYLRYVSYYLLSMNLIQNVLLLFISDVIIRGCLPVRSCSVIPTSRKWIPWRKSTSCCSQNWQQRQRTSCWTTCR